VISSLVSRASAALLLLGGVALLFGADDILPRVIPGFPAGAAWIGQLLAAAWLPLGALNWLNRSAILGGIYGRPIVMANAALYFISAMVLGKIVRQPGTPVAIVGLTVVFGVFAVIYGWLMFRGPLARDVEIHRRAQGSRGV
jgi:hypothetical protein